MTVPDPGDDLGAEAAPDPLVSDGGVDEPVAHHIAPLLDRPGDDARAKLGAGGAEEEQLSARIELERRVFEQPADPLADLGAARLAQQERRRAERLVQQRRLGGLAGAVDALEGDEHGVR